ncbi:amino acid transporter [Microbacterium sp. ZXX196]|uniref:amino acid transporter n=1 Tax=Microbacterium sp. ZXX196 TaxID=2609291 RepID=UPI0012B787E0|nr:amino acid transporter [Microbacterium sp. ZXX196]MTE24446.1 amino acid transporter [Microbacterium sp. ZXX196]
MTEKQPTRRDLMKPVQLIGIALAAALFAGFVTAMSMGAFTGSGGEIAQAAWRMAAIMAGIVFIVVLLVLALLLLVVDPRDVAKPHDGPVLLPKDDEGDGSAEQPSSDASRE